MAPNAQISPVQHQFAIPVPFGMLERGDLALSCRYAGCRHVFWHTGNIVELIESAHKTPKKMQLAFNLCSGAMGLTNSLINLQRNDEPLPLRKSLQRSYSAPCLSNLQLNKSQSIEIVGSLRCSSKLKHLIKEMVKALECGVQPVSASGGLGGAYYFRNVRGESIAVVKPADEEPFAPNNPKGLIGKKLGQPGLKRSIRIGETGIREVAAYLLDHEHFARVPPTILIKARDFIFQPNSATIPAPKTSFNAKIASCQEFVPHNFDASDLGASRFSVSSVHKIGILDVRIFNTDRHGGNILVRTLPGNDLNCNGQLNEPLELIPIDHGFCLPETFEDPYFEWLHWPQASFPFSDDELSYISRLDVAKDVEMLRVELPMLREACLRMLVLCTTFLKRGARAGLCLAEIGEMMSRDSCGMGEASELELLCLQAKLEVDHEISATRSGRNTSCMLGPYIAEELISRDQIQFHMDQEEIFPSGNGFNAAIGVVCKERKKGFSSIGNSANSCKNPISLALCISVDIQARLKNQTLSPLFQSTFLNPSEVCHNLGTLLEIPPTQERKHASKSLWHAESQPNFAITKDAFTREKSLRSISFNYRRQRCPSDLLFKKACKQGISASEIRGKPYSVAGADHLLLGEMSEKEWELFVRIIEELLDEAFVNWKRRGSNRQRLGGSCQF